MYKILIWGTGKVYWQSFSLIQMFIQRKQIEVVGVTSNEKSIVEIDAFRFVPKEQLKNLIFDYCLVAIEDVNSIVEEATLLGIERDRLIPISVLAIPYFDFKKYVGIKERHISIISQMCWGGLCYNQLKLPFDSPTINMAFSETDFLKFISNFEYYLECPVEFVQMAFEANLKREFPVCRIDDIELYFNHYTSYDDAVDCWEKRKKRVNMDDLLFIAYTKDPKIEAQFNALPIERKIIFVPYPTKYSSSVYIEFDKDKYNENFGIAVNHTVQGINNAIDILAFLNGEPEFMRVK